MALAILKHSLETELASNSENRLLCLHSAGIKGIHHHHLAKDMFLLVKRSWLASELALWVKMLTMQT